MSLALMTHCSPNRKLMLLLASYWLNMAELRLLILISIQLSPVNERTNPLILQVVSGTQELTDTT